MPQNVFCEKWTSSDLKSFMGFKNKNYPKKKLTPSHYSVQQKVQLKKTASLALGLKCSMQPTGLNLTTQKSVFHPTV